MPTRTLVCRDEIHLTTEATAPVLSHLASLGTNSTRPTALALSGGRLAKPFFQALAACASLHGVDLNALHYFWADERCVPPEHPDSNFAAAREILLEPFAVPAERIHRLEGEREPLEAAARANADWARWQSLHPRKPAGPDVILLGVGEDGHVASLFPGNLAVDLAATDPFRAVTGPKPPPRRLTMGYPLLWNAGLAVILAGGPGKRMIVEESLAGRIDSPLRRVLAGREDRGLDTFVLLQM